MEKKWWHKKVAYEIYPKSFCDSNGDGIGDIQGIISKLDYLKNLGIDIIWIAPMYTSPFVDQGYDISDYYNIDPTFGTMEDMDQLLAEAKKRGMYILMDLVVNHCSDQHQWFKEAMKDPEGPYGDYFIIREGKDDQPPTNWRGNFGGSVWEKIPGTNKYYLHMYAKEQPDLNWENEKVRNDLFDMMNWWLDKGLAGFRIDAIINIKKDLRFISFPADRDDGLCSGDVMLSHAKGIEIFLREMYEKTFKKHNALAMGELFNYKEEALPVFIGDDGVFSTIFDFSTSLIGVSEKGWYDRTPVTPNSFRETTFQSQRIAEGIGMMANIIENHDEPRGVSRYIPKGDCNDTSIKMLATILMMLKGLPFLFQGQEIGMRNRKFQNIEEINDLHSRDEYRMALDAGMSIEEALEVVSDHSRDNGRTPFQWDDSANAGFTKGQPWLKVNPNFKEVNAESQLEDEHSVLNFYKQLIDLRKSANYEEVVVYGKLEPILEGMDKVMAFYRRGQEKTLLVLANYKNEAQDLRLKTLDYVVLVNNYPSLSETVGGVKMEAYQALVLEVKDEDRSVV